MMLSMSMLDLKVILPVKANPLFVLSFNEDVPEVLKSFVSRYDAHAHVTDSSAVCHICNRS